MILIIFKGTSAKIKLPHKKKQHDETQTHMLDSFQQSINQPKTQVPQLEDMFEKHMQAVLQEKKIFFDVSMLAAKIIEDSSDVIMFQQPSGFGKTLNAAMLFWLLNRPNKKIAIRQSQIINRQETDRQKTDQRKQHADEQQVDEEMRQQNIKMCSSLEIFADEHFMKYHFQKYCCIVLKTRDFFTTKVENETAKLIKIIVQLYEDHGYLKYNKNYLYEMRILNIYLSSLTKNQQSCQVSTFFVRSIERLASMIQEHNKFERPCIIIIDNYDYLWMLGKRTRKQGWNKVHLDMLLKQILCNFVFRFSMINQQKLCFGSRIKRIVIGFCSVKPMTNFLSCFFKTNQVNTSNIDYADFFGVTRKQIQQKVTKMNLLPLDKINLFLNNLETNYGSILFGERKKQNKKLNTYFVSKQIQNLANKITNLQLNQLLPLSQVCKKFLKRFLPTYCHQSQQIIEILKISSHEKMWTQLQCSEAAMNKNFQQIDKSYLLSYVFLCFGITTIRKVNNTLRMYAPNQLSRRTIFTVFSQKWSTNNGFKPFDIQAIKQVKQKYQNILKEGFYELPSRSQSHIHHLLYVCYGLSPNKSHLAFTQKSTINKGLPDNIFVANRFDAKFGVIHEFKYCKRIPSSRCYNEIIENSYRQMVIGLYINIIIELTPKQRMKGCFFRTIVVYQQFNLQSVIDEILLKLDQSFFTEQQTINLYEVLNSQQFSSILDPYKRENKQSQQNQDNQSMFERRRSGLENEEVQIQQYQQDIDETQQSQSDYSSVVSVASVESMKLEKFNERVEQIFQLTATSSMRKMIELIKKVPKTEIASFLQERKNKLQQQRQKELHRGRKKQPKAR